MRTSSFIAEFWLTIVHTLSLTPSLTHIQLVREAVSYRELFTAGWFGVREKYCYRLEIYDRLRASEQVDSLSILGHTLVYWASAISWALLVRTGPPLVQLHQLVSAYRLLLPAQQS